MGLGLAHSNQICAHLMINITTSTSIMATRNNPTRTTIVQEIIEIPSVLIHAHKIKDEINTEDPNGANLVTTNRLHEISIVIKDRPTAMTVTQGRLVVMIEIRGLLVVRQVPPHRIHAGRAVRKGTRTMIRRG